MAKRSTLLLALGSLGMLASCDLNLIGGLSDSTLSLSEGGVASLSEGDASSAESEASVSSEEKDTGSALNSSISSTKASSSDSDSTETSVSSVASLSSESSVSTGASSSSSVIVSSEEITISQSSIDSVSTDVATSSSSASSVSSVISVDDDPNTEFSIVTTDGSYSRSGAIYTIASYGTYTVSGTLVGQIYVDVPETDEGNGEVNLVLSGLNLSYGLNSPIYCASADEFKIKADKKTANTVTDLRAAETTEDDTQGNGAIYSKSDLHLTGKGSLTVVGTYNNGIHTTKDLKIKNQALHVTAPNNAIKGNDSVTIEENPTITAISTGGDAIKTSNTDASSSGKQRGTVTITGGTINLYSACDGIDAAYDVVISDGLDDDGNATSPVITSYTNRYSSYTGEIVNSSTSYVYLLSTSQLSSSYRYSAYFYNTTGDGEFSNATYDKSVRSGRTTYYAYKAEVPSASYSSFKVYKFYSTSSNSTTSYVSVTSSGTTVRTDKDAVVVSSYGSSLSFGSWYTYDSMSSSSGGSGGWPGGGGGFPGGSEGNTDKADVSAKGIKAANKIDISGGSITIQAYDDGIHASYGDTFESGGTGIGDVNISGGEINVSCSDDGVHADRILTISGGEINVSTSYEGLEGNQVSITGGTSAVYAKDDGVNAANATDKANLSPSVRVSGGYLFIAVPSSGDTDGIDSNGTYTQTGGIVITCGPANGGAWALDTDSTVSVSGGTLLVFGGIERTVTSSLTYSTKTGSYSNRAYTVAFSNSATVLTKALPNYSYSKLISYSTNGSVSTVTAA